MQKYMPRTYQLIAKEWMYRKKHSGLFLDMGLGKTAICLDAINRLIYEDFEVRKVLIIAPKKVAESVWAQETKKWSNFSNLRCSHILGSEKKRKDALRADADIYLMNRENTAWLCSQFGGNYLPFDLVILDESSSFKTHKSQRWKALKKAVAQTSRLVLLTGTPSPNGLMDLWSQVYLLDQGSRLGRTITAYREKYFIPGYAVGGVVYKYKLRDGAHAEILNKISDICISMQAKDLLDLPECIYNYIEVELDAQARAAYNEFEANLILQMIEENIELTALSAAGLTNKLLQMANGAVYYDKEKNWVTIHDEKIERLKEILEDNEGKSVLIAYNYKHDFERLMSALKSYSPRILATDKDIQDWNEGKIQIALVHPQSAGHGLNLQFGGHIAIWFGLTWNLELYQQFNKRLHRSGQEHTVIIHHLVARDTEDERAIKALQSKGNIQQWLMDGLKARIKEYKQLFSTI